MKLYVQSVEKKFTKNNKPYYVVKTDQGDMSAWDPVPEKVWIDGDVEKKGQYTNLKSFTEIKGETKAPAGMVDRWYMSFVSNMCAHLIQVGIIKEPADLNMWARHAKSVAFFLDANEDTDEIPFE